MPIRLPIRPVTTEPITAPMEATAMTSPSAPGWMSRYWFAYRITSAQKTKLKKLIVAVAKSDGRITDECQIHDIPARRWPCSAVSVGGSSGLILLSEKAEIRYEKASASSATGADRACTSTPPMLGPPTNERARLPLRSDCPST